MAPKEGAGFGAQGRPFLNPCDLKWTAVFLSQWHLAALCDDPPPVLTATPGNSCLLQLGCLPNIL